MHFFGTSVVIRLPDAKLRQTYFAEFFRSHDFSLGKISERKPYGYHLKRANVCDHFVDTLSRDTQEVSPSRTVFRL